MKKIIFFVIVISDSNQFLLNYTVIFEEAAQILESSIVATLTKSVQHLILIGKQKLEFSIDRTSI